MPRAFRRPEIFLTVPVRSPCAIHARDPYQPTARLAVTIMATYKSVACVMPPMMVAKPICRHQNYNLLTQYQPFLPTISWKARARPGVQQHQVPTDVAARPGATSIDGPATLREQHQVANDVPGPGPLTTAESQRCCKPPRCRSGVAVRGGKLSDRVVAQALLDRVKDRDALSDEPGGDLAQAVGPVQHVEVRALKPDRGLLHDLR